MKPALKRYTVRGQSAAMSVTAVRAAAEAAHASMLASAWAPRDGTASDLPPHKYAQGAPRDEYDAFLYGGDYAADDAQCVQRAYCGAVSYSAPLPPGALSGAPCALLSVSVRAYGDRWLAQGARLDVFLGASPLPPPIADIESGAAVPAATTGEPADAGDGEAPFPPPFRKVVRSNSGADSAADVSLPLGEGGAGLPLSAATRYLHLVLRLADYGHVGQTPDGADSAWLEGGAALSAASAELAFSRAVAPAALAPRARVPAEPARLLAWDASDNAAAYAYRPFVFDQDVPGACADERDYLHSFGFPAAGVVRATSTPAGYAADPGRPFVCAASGCFCGVDVHGLGLFGVGGSTEVLKRWGAYSGVQVSTFLTAGRRYASASLAFEARRVAAGQSALEAMPAGSSVEIRLDLYALPWPLLVFTPPGADDLAGRLMSFARVLDLGTLCDEAFLAGAAQSLSFVDDPGFFRAGIGFDHGGVAGAVHPLYRCLAVADGEGDEPAGTPIEDGHQVWSSTAFPCVPVATALLALAGDGQTVSYTRTVRFPAPLDAPEKTVLLAHFRPAAPAVGCAIGWKSACTLASISESE